LFITYEILTNGYEPIYLDWVSILAIISGIFVIISKNPVISVLFLIALFVNISGYLILIGINFIGLSYLLVYLGAVFVYAGLVKIQLYKEFNSKQKINSVILNSNINKFNVVNNTIGSVRFYSTSNNNNISSNLSDEEFFEWLSGFIDGEGHFRIRKDIRRKDSPFSFEFIINLHSDDKDALYYIQKRLNQGNVSNYSVSSRFSISSQIGVKLLISILDKYPLNTSKRLDYEDWKKAFVIYNDNKSSLNKESVISSIESIRIGMNTGRPYSVYNSNAVITKYWLLGFIEGESSFIIHLHNLTNSFTLGQSSKDRPLLEKIVEFLKSYNKNIFINESAISISDKSKNEILNQNPYSEIYSSNTNFFRDVLVPLLNNLTWQTKKYKDFVDWSLVLNMKSVNLHKTERGKEIIEMLYYQMNNYRLSTNLLQRKTDRVLLHNEINSLLNQSSLKKNTLELWICNLETNTLELLMSFPSVYSCAKYLNVNKYTINQGLKNNKPIFVDNKKYFVKLS
jgi:NADH:ubiquinone oxidoreductase subunit 6 (subunit J)